MMVFKENSSRNTNTKFKTRWKHAEEAGSPPRALLVQQDTSELSERPPQKHSAEKLLLVSTPKVHLF